MTEHINILLVEDNPGDVRLIQEMLKDTDFSEANMLVANKLGDTLRENIFGTDIVLILLDLSLPDSDGLHSIQSIRRYFPDSALIVLTGLNDGQVAINALREGAQNYLVKGEIDSKILDKSIRFSIEQHNVILKLKQAHDELKENRYFLEKAQEVAHIGHWISDLNEGGKAVWSNETCRIFGFEKKEFDGRFETFFSMVHPDDLADVTHHFLRAIEGKQPLDVTHRILRKDKSVRWVHCQADVVGDKLEHSTKVVGVIRDITDQKTAEEERSKILKDLLLHNKDLEQFAYIVSHNLRAPVANIMGITDVLNNKEFTEDEKTEFRQWLAVSVKKLDDIIMDLNHVLQVKRELNEKKEVVNFQELIDDITTTIHHLLNENEVEIETDFSEANEMITIKSYLYSIFYNLISNCIKFRKPDVALRIEVMSRTENERTLISFKDNGLGIDMVKKGGQIFGLYKRFHTHVEGKGLGLFMVKTQVETLGGKIFVTSELNKGTEFTIVF